LVQLFVLTHITVQHEQEVDVLRPVTSSVFIKYKTTLHKRYLRSVTWNRSRNGRSVYFVYGDGPRWDKRNWR